ncbi:MAG: hypothetical protein JWP97_3029 [Labilithrix sp.]|nr:hypothetical protein [Labilithrix sp.]
MNIKPLLAIGLVVSVTTGCSFLKKKKPAEEDPSVQDAPTVTVNGTGAKNEKDVLRYANETAVSDVPATIAHDGVKAKTFPQSGADVATLSKGTTVVQKAKFFSTGVLVLFDDPTTKDGTKLLGWIEPAQLGTGTAAATANTTTPTAGIPVKPLVDAGKPADGGSLDAGPVDAGTVDAGKAAAPVLFANPVNNKCTAPFTLFDKPVKLCRIACTTNKDCPAPSACSDVTGAKKSCK